MGRVKGQGHILGPTTYQHPFCSMSIGPPVLGIWLFHNLTLEVQGQDHSSRSHSESNTLYIHMLYIYWLTSVSFHVNWTSYSWYTAFLKFDLENPKSRSQWGQSSKLQSGSNLLSTHIPFILCQLVNWSSNSWDMAFSKFDLENLRSKSYLKITYCSSAVQRRSPNATHKWNGQPISAQWMVRFATNEFLTCFSQFNNCMWFGKILQSFWKLIDGLAALVAGRLSNLKKRLENFKQKSCASET